MLLEEFDVKKYERSLRAEGREEESERYSKLICLSLEQHREQDLKPRQKMQSTGSGCIRNSIWRR